MNRIPNKEIIFKDLGIIDYKTAWDFQYELFDKGLDLKKKNRNLAQNQQIKLQNHLLFCEHPPVYTLGKSGKMENLLLNEIELKTKKIDFYKIDRGGDITFHGPGQIVGYPIFDLEQFKTDLTYYLYNLEEAAIRTLAEYGIKAGRIKKYTGVWLDENNPEKARKICALGVRASRWITMHGFAFNVNTNLEYFKNIVPCGIEDKSVTSMQKELGYKLDFEEVKLKLKNHYSRLFEAKILG